MRHVHVSAFVAGWQRPLVCPHCRRPFNTVGILDRQGLTFVPAATSDLLVCFGCLGVMTWTAKRRLRKATRAHVAQAPEAVEEALVRILAVKAWARRPGRC
jgi:hypothetical protein